MSTGYAIAYRLGVTPWERAGGEATAQFNALLDREQEGDPPFGRALDIGCGTGDHAVNLARRGWDVTGVDFVPRALLAARAKATEAGVNVRFLHADVTAMAEQTGGGYRFLLDVGCFHGLKPVRRPIYAQEVNAVSAPGATMLMLAFQPGRRPPVPLPRGASREEIETTFMGWTVVTDDAADTTGMPSPLKRTAPRFFRLRRSG